MNGKDLGERLVEEYRIDCKRTINSKRIPLFTGWVGEASGPYSEPEILHSLDEVKDHIAKRFPDNWKLEKETKRKNGTIYTFSHKQLNGLQGYDYVHLRIRPKVVQKLMEQYKFKPQTDI